MQTAGSAASPMPWLRSLVPEQLRAMVLMLEAWQWLGLLVLALAGIIVDRLVTVILFAGVRRAFHRHIPNGDEAMLSGAVRPFGVLAMALVWRVGLLPLALTGRVEDILLLAANFVAAGGGVWAAYRFVDVLAEYAARRAAVTATRYDDLLVPLLRKSLKVFIVAFGLVFIADSVNIKVTSLLAGLGLGGLAFALAAQDTVKNLFGSLTVLLDRPFQVGDWIVVGSQEGMVEEVGFRSTRIRTFHNSLITMPNSLLIATPVDNMGARMYRRWSTTLSLTYDTPPGKIEAFCEGVRELIRLHPDTRKDYFQVYGREFASASLEVLLYVFFTCPDWGTELQARHRLFLDILRLAQGLGVEFAFPTQTLHVLRPGELPDHGELPEPEAAKAKGRALAGTISAKDGKG
jgi:MscS family membrane protein